MYVRLIRCTPLAALLAALVALAGCKSAPTGRLLEEGEDDLVGSRDAGAAVYDRLITSAVEKILKSHSAAHTGAPKLKVAFLGVENAGIEDLGDWTEHLYELIDTSVNVADRYRTVSRRFVEAALRETRLRRDQLFLPGPRRQYASTLEQTGNPLDLLMFAKLTTGTTRGEGVSQRNYTLTLEVVDIETGWNEKVSADRVRKAYTK